MKIGFIGLGIMGKPMAKNLLKAGYELNICDINKDAVADVAASGGRAYDTPRETAAESDIILTMLPNSPHVKTVIEGKDGVLEGMKPGTILVDMSSIDPNVSIELEKEVAAAGGEMLDAPVSGGEPGAVAGTLAFMAGGEQKDFDVLKPYFDIMGSSALLVGDSGSGSVTKLANQVIVNNTIAIVSEAFVLAVKAGADPVKVYEAIRGGLAGSAVLDAKIPMIVERNFTPGGKISINHKDIKNVINTAHELDVPVPYIAQLFEILQSLKVHGHMDEDHSGIVQYFERLADVVVKKMD